MRLFENGASSSVRFTRTAYAASLLGLATAGISTKIKVAGLGVLLETAHGNTTNPNDPSATWKISDAGQEKMTEA